MHEVIERAITDDERRRLLELMPLLPPPSIQWLRLLRRLFEVACVVLLGAILIATHRVHAAIVIPCLILVLALYWKLEFKEIFIAPWERFRSASEPIARYRAAVSDAKAVRVHRVQASEVVQVLHDHGTICLFRVGDQQTYLIDPYMMTPGRPCEKWPNSSFEVFEVPQWEWEVGPLCHGERLAVRKTMVFSEVFGDSDFDVPRDGVINQPLDAFLRERQLQKG